MSIKAVIVAVSAIALLAPVSAQAQRYEDRGGDRGGNTPNGSYSQSCSNAYVNGGRLYAQCQDTRRGRRTSSLDITGCGRSDIANDDGLLICGSGRGRFENGNGNGGGWSGGNGGGNNGGGWNGGNGGGWGGRNAITVYGDSNFRGESATFNREIQNLRGHPLNDNISSLETGGTWEACSDAYFQGTCQTFTGSVRNLNSTSINDRISSLRPVRGGY